MKPVRWGLLKHLGRQALPATAVGAIGLGLLALLWPGVLIPVAPWPALVILAQCFMLAVAFGRFGRPSFAFTYSRGYSRDALWGHMMLASALSAAAAWVIASLLLWTGLRSLLHDRLLHSPYFPVMVPRETWTPIAWLGLYVLFIPTCHYAWIRLAQPTGSRWNGMVLAVMLLGAPVGFVIAPYFYPDNWFVRISGVLYVAVVTCLVWGGRALHRSLEVRA